MSDIYKHTGGGEDKAKTIHIILNFYRWSIDIHIYIHYPDSFGTAYKYTYIRGMLFAIVGRKNNISAIHIPKTDTPTSNNKLK